MIRGFDPDPGLNAGHETFDPEVTLGVGGELLIAGQRRQPERLDEGFVGPS